MMNGNKMKRYILVILTGILLLGCKTEPAYPDHSEPPLTSISAFVPIGDSEVEFKGIPDEEGHILKTATTWCRNLPWKKYGFAPGWSTMP